MSKRNPNATDYNYVKQMLAWGFTIDFVAKDNNITVEAIERRMSRHAKKAMAA